MFPFIFRRIIASIPVLLLSSALVFFIIQMAPGDFLTPLKLSPSGGEEKIRILTQQFGLDKPVWQQYLIWLKNMVTGNFGQSFAYEQPVLGIALPRILNSLWLVLLNIGMFYPLAIALGVYGAVRQYSFGDRFFSVLLYFLLGFPTFFLALIVIFFALQLRFKTGWDIPLNGMVSDNHASLSVLGKFWDYLSHMLLPATVLTLISLAGFTRGLRGLMLDTLNSDYVRTARSKGLSSNKVTFKHALRNAILPIVTQGGLLVIGLLGGSIITETIFAYPGIGQWFIQSALQLDIAGVMGFTLLSALLVVVMSTVVDIIYGMVDPRVRFD